MRQIVFFSLLLAASFSLAARAALPIGTMAPDYLGKSSSGDPVTVAAMADKPLIVTFWASWCGPCLQEMPLLEALQRKLGRERINVVAINWGEDRERYREILGQLNEVQMTLTHDRRKSIGKAYEVDAIPQLYLIDPAGRIAYQSKGYSLENAQELLDALNEMLRAPAMTTDPAAAAADGS